MVTLQRNFFSYQINPIIKSWEREALRCLPVEGWRRCGVIQHPEAKWRLRRVEVEASLRSLVEERM